MEELSTYDTSTLRIAVEKHLKATKNRSFEEIHAEGRVYLLTRYVFAVPPDAPPGTPAFAGWWHSPGEPRHNWLWPLVFDEKGRPQLVATGAVYTGMPQRVLAEFDHCRKKFGRRRATSPTKE